ncbi:MAG: hypothetical protein ACREMQ_17850 [Longimicrobiales bacterium]
MADEERGVGVRGGAAAPLAATAVVLACTAFLRFQGGVAPPSPGDFAVDSAGDRPYLAVIVAQAADCRDGVRYLGVLRAEDVRARVRVSGLVIGGSEDVEYARKALAQKLGPLPVRAATRRNLAALRALRLPATPYLLVMDGAGTLLLSTPAPRDGAGADRLRRSLSLLTT